METEESDPSYENEEAGSGRSSSVSLEEEGSSSSGEQMRGEKRSKHREDRGLREGKVAEGTSKGGRKGEGADGGRRAELRKGKGKVLRGEGVEEVEEPTVEVVIRHRCTLEAVCAVNAELDEEMRAAIAETMWRPVLSYRPFVMDGHLVRTLIQCWNAKTQCFKIGRREVPFSVYDVALITGLPAHGKAVVGSRSGRSGEVEEILKEAMQEHVSREHGRQRTKEKEMRIYRNYMSVLVELCRKNSRRGTVGTFSKLYAFLVVSGLLFSRGGGGVAWDMVSLVEDVRGMGEYNWAAATWEFLIQAVEEGKEKMCDAKNVQINGFPMILQVTWEGGTSVMRWVSLRM